MAKPTIFFGFILLAALLHRPFVHGSNDNQRKAYIVYMGDAAKGHISAGADRHHSLLSSVIGDEDTARVSRVHSYWKSFDGFAANLLPEEVNRLKEHEEVVSVFPSTVRKLHTTRSWDFLGMPLSVNRNSQKESDIIVGMLDTGIYIDAPSFDDKGFGPPPSKWKGVCQSGANFTGCNNKVIGARVYNLEHQGDPNYKPSPADDIGHGTHTASTVAGIPVKGANLYGLAKGIARGGVPSARLAIYKVCDNIGCSDADLLAAFDDAIHDGVDLISLSVGGGAKDYFTDSIAIGAFHAMKKGILTSCSGGNDGPVTETVANVAPWMLTVGASGLDRQFRSLISMGNGMKISGISINTFAAEGKNMYPLTSGLQALNSSSEDGDGAAYCDFDSLDESKVKGKIVLCVAGGLDVDYSVKQLGGLGIVIASDTNLDTAMSYMIPAANIDTQHANKIEEYINSTKNPQAVIFKSIVVNVSAPFVASFSSRGPNVISPTILKPDVVAPGVDILAAYSKLASLTGNQNDDRFDVYNIISGTSMSCPHATAAAAFIKSFHPQWSPAAIKSALMTTASEMKVGEPMAELAYGAGQIDPVRALNPGLVYDMSTTDYLHFLCKNGYTGTALSIISGEKINCSKNPSFGGNDALNYPSMIVQVEESNSRVSAAFLRTVTNVGPAKSTYKAMVNAPKNLNITVTPDALVFSQVNEKKSFKVEAKGPPIEDGTVLSASLEWTNSDSSHKVRSPIVISSQQK